MKYAPPCDAYVVHNYKPRRGDCLVFSHHLLHDGGRLTSGTKYIMRTELMYRRRDDDEMEIMRQAQDTEQHFDDVGSDGNAHIDVPAVAGGGRKDGSAHKGKPVPVWCNRADCLESIEHFVNEAEHGVHVAECHGKDGSAHSGDPEPVWCNHADCLESIEHFVNEAELGVHVAECHT